MTFPTDQARIQIARRNRRRLLHTLYVARGNADAWLGGRFLLDVANMATPRSERIENDGDALALAGDLIGGGYAMERDDRERRTDPYGMEYISFKITARGVSLIEQTIEPDPSIDDDRILK